LIQSQDAAHVLYYRALCPCACVVSCGNREHSSRRTEEPCRQLQEAAGIVPKVDWGEVSGPRAHRQRSPSQLRRVQNPHSDICGVCCGCCGCCECDRRPRSTKSCGVSCRATASTPPRGRPPACTACRRPCTTPPPQRASGPLYRRAGGPLFAAAARRIFLFLSRSSPLETTALMRARKDEGAV
jgi:hypothetical protein